MGTHENLDVWKLSIDFVVDIYKLTETFPRKEKYGLSKQMERCAISIPSNIAEGAGRRGDKENLYFLSISLGSITELETQLIVSKKLQFHSSDIELRQLRKIKSMLINYMKYLRSLN